MTVQPGRVQLTPGERLDLLPVAVNNDESPVARPTATYRSSNPRVATVTPAGRVAAVAGGVTTILATVGGVTGSTPIVVKQPFALQAPAPRSSPGRRVRRTTRSPAARPSRSAAPAPSSG